MTKKERFVLWLNKLGRGCNRITIIVLYITIMIMLGAIIYGANQQKATSNVTVTYSRPSYTVTFDPQGGEVSPSSKTVKLGDNYGDLPTLTKTGYFLVWQKEDGTAVTSTTQNTTIGDHTLTASWMPNIYKVTLDKQGGAGGLDTYWYKFEQSSPAYYYSDDSCSTAVDGSTGVTITVPIKTGYTFGGYYTSTDGSGTQYVNSSGGTVNNRYLVADNITLYANWIINTYILKIDPNGGYRVSDGSTSVISVSKNYNATENIVERAKKGYTLTGWKIKNSSNNSETDIGGASITALNSNKEATFTQGDVEVTLVAQWSANTIKITLNKNGGTGGTSEFYYKYGTNTFYTDSSCSTTLSKPSLPTRAGYTFVHYYGDGTCGGNNGERYAGYADVSYGFASDLCTDIYQNATLYASWSAIATTISANTTSVTYKQQGSPGSITVSAGGGGGKWTYSVVSATVKTYNNGPTSIVLDPNSCISLSTTGATTGSVVVTCSGKFLNAIFAASFDPATYTYVIRATSAYNGTTADITLTFNCIWG